MEKNRTPQSGVETQTASQPLPVAEKPATEPLIAKETVTAEPYADVEFGNMTDAAIKHFIVMHPDIPKDRKVGDFTVEQWIEASDLGFKTPKQLKEYRGF